MENYTTQKTRRWWLAGLLSFLVPGLGQVYNGQETKGLFFYFLLSVWGGLLLSMVYYLLKQPVTPMNIGAFCLLSFISFIAWLLIIIESIHSAKKISKDYKLKRYNKWYIYLLVILIVQFVDLSAAVEIRENVIRAYKIPAGSMKPTLMIGDHLLCDLTYYQTNNPARGDIIIFKYPQDERIDFVKRIIGIPGDTIQIKNDDVYVNNEKLELKYIEKYKDNRMEADRYQESLGNISYRILDDFKKHEYFGPIVVPEDEYFVMGDNRDNSHDSRYWGTVKRHKIQGKAIFIYFSWDKEIPLWNIFGRLSSIRFSRIGEILQ